MASSSAPEPKLRDNVSRVKRPTPGGHALFVGLRGADIALQYTLLAHHAANPLLHFLGVPTLPAPVSVGSSSGLWAGLSALPLQPRLLLGFAFGSWLKQSYWAIFITENEMSAGSAIGVSLFNSIFNSLNSIVSTIAPLLAPLLPSVAGAVLSQIGIVSPSQPNPNTLSPTFLLGAAMCVTGLGVEAVSEAQRHSFKSRPENKGKVFTGGLFSIARHINYGAYTVWRSGYALAAGGPVWGAFVFGFFFRDFATRGVPVLDGYCSKRVSQMLMKIETVREPVLTPRCSCSMANNGVCTRQRPGGRSFQGCIDAINPI